jgi:hypothetical protein
VHHDGGAGLLSFRVPTADVKTVHDVLAIPHLVNSEGKKFADPQTGPYPKDYEGSISQGVAAVQTGQGAFQFFRGQSGTTDHAFLLKRKRRPLARKVAFSRLPPKICKRDPSQGLAMPEQFCRGLPESSSVVWLGIAGTLIVLLRRRNVAT